jgi:pimeloyl-ACP methyl ester carboxylesterase
MATFLIAHGAWSAGWAWKKMRPRLRDRGHELWTPTYTGLGERVHLASSDVKLDTHIEDVVKVIEFEDLRDVILVGHSYGGMVATGVGDRIPDRISQVIYLDAFVPRNGQSVFELAVPDDRIALVEAARKTGDAMRIPPRPMPPDTSAADLAWGNPRRVPQPIAAFEQPIRLTGAIEQLRRTYIYCTRPRPGDVFRQFAERAKSENGWRYREIDASHNPHITVPDELAEMLHELAE